jgi:DNA-binding transcriptional ArsR family regulator
MSFERPEAAGPEASPGSPADPVEITDPRALRALAHPARIAIMQHLIIEGPATATECASVAGLSPSACSYHLRALARYGFAEEDRSSAVDGRHRPWRARAIGLKFATDPDRPEAVRAAERILADTFQASVEDVRARYLDHESEYPPEWQRAAGLRQDVLHVTPDELTEITDAIGRMFDRYRRLRRADRPPGARRVQAIADFTPWFSPKESA